MIHVAILVKPYLDLILSGEKTVESRLTKTARTPFERIAAGERIYFKQSSGRFRATALASAVHLFSDLSPRQVGAIRREWNGRIRGDAQFWQWKRDSRYATLIELEAVEPIEFGPRVNPQRGVAWLTLDDSLDVYPACLDHVMHAIPNGAAGASKSAAASIMLPLTAGNIRQGSVSARRALDRFPADAIGGTTKAAAGRPLTLRFPDGLVISTDIVGEKGIFRARGAWRAWFTKTGAAAGDALLLTPRGRRMYDVSLARGVGHSGPNRNEPRP